MSSDKGYILLYRDIRSHWVWTDPEMLRAWIDLIMMVNHENKKIVFDGKLVTVKRGSVIASLRKLSARWGWSKDKTSRFLDLLEAEGMIRQERDTKKTLLSLENYSFYQSNKSKRETPKRRRTDTDKDTDKDTERNKQYTNNTLESIEKEKEAPPPLSQEEQDALDEAEGWGYD